MPMGRKNSPYTKFFQSAIIELIENGKMDFYNTRNFLSQSACKSTNSANPLGIPKLATLFFTLLFGCALSFVFLLYERFYGTNMKKDATFERQEKKEFKIRIEAVKIFIPQILNESLKKKAEKLMFQIDEICLHFQMNKPENSIQTSRPKHNSNP